MAARRIQRNTRQAPNRWSWGVAFLMALALLASSAAILRSREAAPPMPKLLQGRWITHEPSHADRFIELGERTVALGTGGILGTISAVRRVSRRPAERRGYHRYEIELMDTDGMTVSTLELDYRQGVVPTLAVPNVSGYWERENSRWSR